MPVLDLKKQAKTGLKSDLRLLFTISWHQMAFLLHATLYSLFNYICIVDEYSNKSVPMLGGGLLPSMGDLLVRSILR